MQTTHKKFIILLFIVIVGCLGSLPIAPHFLIPVKVQPTAVATPTPTYTDGQCTTDILTQTHATSTIAAPPQSIAKVWAQEKYTNQDFTNALSCATAFVDLYESFDYHQMQSLYTAIPLLSADAKKRFYQGYENASANVRTNQTWESQLQKTQTVQQVKTSSVTLDNYTNKNNEFFLTVNIPCKLTKQVQGKPTTQNISVTVLLKKVQPDKNTHGVGWQISDWRENTATA
jgi:hypothetical protein